MNSAVYASVVRFPLAATTNADDLRAFVADRVPELDGAGARALLPVDGVYTTTLYVTSIDDASFLEWYVEVDRTTARDGAWSDPASRLREASPLFDAGLAGHLADEPVAVLGPEACKLHETHPRRPSHFQDRTDDLPIVLSAPADANSDVDVDTDADSDADSAVDADGSPDTPRGDEAAEGEDRSNAVLADGNGAGDRPAGAGTAAGAGTPAIAATRLEIRPGLATRFVNALAWLMDAVDDDGAVEGQFEAWSEPVVEDEVMYTESFFLEPVADGLYLDYYMEADDVQGVYDAYYDSNSLVARLSDVVMRRIFANPERMLEDIVGHSAHDPLVHATNANRP